MSPQSSTLEPDPADLKVLVRNAHGKYLAQDEHGLFFTDNKCAAIVLNWKADRVAEQLESIRKNQGIALVADPIPLDEIYETCDRCEEFFMPSMVMYDGKQFLCAECRARLRRRKN